MKVTKIPRLLTWHKLTAEIHNQQLFKLFLESKNFLKLIIPLFFLYCMYNILVYIYVFIKVQGCECTFLILIHVFCFSVHFNNFVYKYISPWLFLVTNIHTLHGLHGMSFMSTAFLLRHVTVYRRHPAPKLGWRDFGGLKTIYF